MDPYLQTARGPPCYTRVELDIVCLGRLVIMQLAGPMPAMIR